MPVCKVGSIRWDGLNGVSVELNGIILVEIVPSRNDLNSSIIMFRLFSSFVQVDFNAASSAMSVVSVLEVGTV